MSRRLRRTKIVTTLGPATDRDNNLEKIIAAGANVVRMNFSHGTPEDHKLRLIMWMPPSARVCSCVCLVNPKSTELVVWAWR